MSVLEPVQSAGRAPGLEERIAYRTRYFDDAHALLERILAKTVVPYQIEVQPGRIKGREICWMPCSYCYGGSSENTGERLKPDRYVDLIKQTANGPHGRVDKIIYAGYATDPLNYEHIDDLIAVSQELNQVIGVHSKLLRASARFVDLMTRPSNRDTNYITVSVDAGTPDSYNRTHSITTKADLYSKVIENVARLNRSRRERGATLDISTNYLLTRENSDPAVVESGIRDLIEAGADSVRFSYPQLPRGMEKEDGSIILTRQEIDQVHARLKPVVAQFSGERTKVLLLDYDSDQQISERRTLPCFARFIYPTIAYDGWLSNCSQSAALHFRDMALGNLQTRDFWDAYYDYDTTDFWSFLDSQHQKMTKNDCRCDRKEHTVNRVFQDAFRAG
jgi:MoaA/NifB/PqqE/SkfB family radical SAM enzyme